MISSLLSTNKFLNDETTYKLKIFEERYSQYSKQLNVIVSSMRYYGYDTLVHNVDTVIIDEEVNAAEELFKQYRRAHYNEQTAKTFKFLHHINESNIEVYRDIMKGAYGIFRDEEYREQRETNNLYVEDIEIVLKNLPIYMKLYTFYEPETIIDIYDYCLNKNTNKINYSQLERIKKLVTIEDNRRKHKIDFPIYKFILDAQQFAVQNEYVDKQKLIDWLANYSAKIANSIKNLVIDDVDLLDTIFDLTKELFDIVVVKKESKRGVLHIQPFELLWERKYNLFDQFGGSIYTKEFFIEELVNNIKDNEYSDDEYIKDRDLEMTDKLRLEDVQQILPKILHKSYDYYVYSGEDGSNTRFIEKQEHTKHEHFIDVHDTLVNQVIQEQENKNKDLFGNEIV